MREVAETLLMLPALSLAETDHPHYSETAGNRDGRT